MDRVGAYNQRSSAYNMCGANEDDVVEPQRTTLAVPGDRASTTKYNTRTTTPSRRRPLVQIEVRLMMRRRDDREEGRERNGRHKTSSPRPRRTSEGP